MSDKDAQQDLLSQALDKLEALDAQIVALETERAELRSFVNQICKFSGRDPMFSDVGSSSTTFATEALHGPQKEIAAHAVRGNLRIRSDEFFDKPLAAAVRAYLELRKIAGLDPASPEEIHAALIQGGFEFPSKDEREQMRGLQVSISKNSQTFRKLPNGLYGLIEWYKPRRRLV